MFFFNIDGFMTCLSGNSQKLIVMFRVVVSFDVDQTINHETFDDDEGTNDGQVWS